MQCIVKKNNERTKKHLTSPLTDAYHGFECHKGPKLPPKMGIRGTIHSSFNQALEVNRVVRLVFDEPKASSSGGRKATFSTSLPLALKNRLDTQTFRLKRNKADVVRAALHQFLQQPVEQRDSNILLYYSKSDRRDPRPFTTTLPHHMKDEIGVTSATLMRPKADVLRAALWRFFGLSSAEQEKRILKYLSEPGT